MFKLLTSKKGYTLVELIIVLLLLTLGSVALMNLFSVASRSYQKSEERFIKQEAVKEVAALLQTGTTSVAAAKTADIFGDSAVVPSGEQSDESYSYLFAIESYNDKNEFEGFFLYVQNKGMPRGSAIKLSETPIYVEIKPYVETVTKLKFENGKEVEYSVPQQYNAVTITLSALENEYDYTKGPPTSDDKYYSIDVAYHFPNMAISVDYCMVNHITESQYATAPLYSEQGVKTTSEVEAVHCTEAKCSYSHCKSNVENVVCDINDCSCPNKSGIVLRVYCDSIISPDNTEAAVSVPSMCFIATASYGLDSGEVGALCAFRDECLKKSALGRAFIDAYYTVSPPIAEFISESEPLKAVVRTALKPVVVVAQYALDESIRVEGIASFAVIMLSGACATALIMKIEKNYKKAKKSK